MIATLGLGLIGEATSMSRLFLASSEPEINFVRAFLSLETRLSHGQTRPDPVQTRAA